METVHVGITVAEMYANAMTRRLVPYKNYANSDVSGNFAGSFASTVCSQAYVGLRMMNTHSLLH